MALLSLKKPAPAGWVTLAGLSLVSLNVLEKLHSFRPSPVTLSYVLCDDILPVSILSVFIFWSLSLESRKKFGHWLLLLVLVIHWVDMVGSTFLMIGKTTQELRLMIHNFSTSEYVFWVVLMGFDKMIFYFLTAWTFYKKTPWYFTYEEVDPFQNVLFKFVGALFFFFAIFKTYEVLAVTIQAFSMRLI
jgi:hypothetical protein